jgi:predicted kinase/disulfide oxidoreductase YuzD
MKFKQFLTESINDKGILKAIILGGLPASGKSTVIHTIINDGSFPISVPDADYWTEKHNGEWSADNKKLANSTYLMTLNGLRPVYLDTVSGNPEDFKNRVNDLQSMGYDVDMVFVDMDLETALQRVSKRNKTQKRQVSNKHIINTYNAIYGKGKYKSIGSTPLFKQYTKILGKKPIVIDGHNLEWNDATKKVYNKVIKFLSSPIKNKKGKKLVDFMKKNGYKYYMDIPEEWLIGHGYPRLKSISYYKTQNWKK